MALKSKTLATESLTNNWYFVLLSPIIAQAIDNWSMFDDFYKIFFASFNNNLAILNSH